MKRLKISLEDLVIAYRKAKVDAFYESGHNTALSFADYESNLLRNLKALQSDINSGSSKWVREPSFVGKYAMLLKSVKRDSKPKKVIHSNSKKGWSKDEKASIDFRIIGQHSVNFHILSSLWIDTVGYRLETNISENSYGCRLKRTGQQWDSFINDENRNTKPNKLQQGHFRSYITDYKKWQKNGIREIQNSLQNEPRLVVTTFDIRKFYHRIDPNFLLEDVFINDFIKTPYTEKERQITELLISAIEFWGDQILSDPLIPETFKTKSQCGIPLGLGCSKVIANLILISIDKEIENKLKPVFYGRYVDDFFLVIKDKPGSIETSEDLWRYISSKVTLLSSSTDASQTDNDNYNYELPYSEKSTIEFGRDKEKIFILEGTSGEVLIEKILNDLNDNSSEWKMLPDAEENLDELTRSIVSSSADESDETPSLRNADKISIQRLKFSLRLRDYETMVGLAPEAIWKEGLVNFFKISLDFILSAENIPIYQKYYPRIVRLAIRSNRYKSFMDIWNRYQESWALLKEKVVTKEEIQLLNRCQEYGNKLVIEAILTSLPIGDDGAVKKWKKVFKEHGVVVKSVKDNPEKLFFADLHFVPFKRVFLDKDNELPNGWGFRKYSINEFQNEVDSSILKLNTRRAFIKKVSPAYVKLNHDFVPKASFFFTRPHNMLEISFLIPDWCTTFRMGELNSMLSLFGIPNIPASFKKPRTDPGAKHVQEVEVPALDGLMSNPSFALTSLETAKDSWEAVVSDNPLEPDYTRYARLFQLINEILKRKESINYVVFPELSIPRSILLYFAQKLKAKKISLIAGVEYEKRSTKGSAFDEVSNQLFIILNTIISGRYEQLVIVQEKVEAAIHEKSDLKEIGNKKLVPKNEFKFLINHGGFYFSGLICNDFLNISYRDALRGLIDALIVIEWNSDIETYDSLVQSCSNDLHCFIMQVNNRSYGDTRLRGPYKEAYKRDQVRIRGGEFDYFVLVTLEVDELRKFQKKQPSPKLPFKPTPTGYKMSKKRM